MFHGVCKTKQCIADGSRVCVCVRFTMECVAYEEKVHQKLKVFDKVQFETFIHRKWAFGIATMLCMCVYSVLSELNEHVSECNKKKKKTKQKTKTKRRNRTNHVEENVLRRTKDEFMVRAPTVHWM